MLKYTKQSFTKKHPRKFRVLSVLALMTSLSACMSSPFDFASSKFEDFTDSLLRPAAQPLDAPNVAITLEAAQKRTLNYNSEYSRQERQFAETVRLSGQRGKDLLPKVYLNGFGQWRSNVNASIGTKVDDQNTSAGQDFFTGQDRVYGVSNLTATWDLLELGMSGLRANKRMLSAFKQGEQNQYLCNKLMVDVEHAYWRAVAYDQAAKRADWLKSRIEFALELSQERVEDNPEAKLSELMFQRELLDINRWYESIFRGLISARADLARLMNLPLGTEFILSETTLTKDLEGLIKMDVNTLVELAYKNRPEIRQALYTKDLIELGNKEAIYSHFPALKLFVGANTDSNSFLLNQDFASAGVNLSWDLLRLSQIGETKRLGQTRLKDQRRETEVMASAIMAQVMVAREQVEKTNHDLSLAEKAFNVQAKITESLSESVQSEDKPETYLVKEELMRELSKLRENLARAELYTANARLNQSVGLVELCAVSKPDHGYKTVHQNTLKTAAHQKSPEVNKTPT